LNNGTEALHLRAEVALEKDFTLTLTLDYGVIAGSSTLYAPSSILDLLASFRRSAQS
jgi:hypothetical protein